MNLTQLQTPHILAPLPHYRKQFQHPLLLPICPLIPEPKQTPFAMSTGSDFDTVASTAINMLSSAGRSISSFATEIIKNPTTWAIAGAGATAGLMLRALSSNHGSSKRTRTDYAPSHFLRGLRADFKEASLQPGRSLAHKVGGTTLMLTAPEAECLSRAVNYVLTAEDAHTVITVDQFMKEKGAQGILTWMTRPTREDDRWSPAARRLLLKKMEEARTHAPGAARMSCSFKQTGQGGEATSLTAGVVSVA